MHEVNAEYQRNGQIARTEANQEIAEFCAKKTGSAFQACIGEKLETYFNVQSTNHDLRAQQDMAFWAMALFYSSTVLTTVGILLLWLTLQSTRQTLREAEKATKAAQDTVTETRRIGEAQTRAYIAMADSNFTARDNLLIINIGIKNDGQSPAKNLKFRLIAEIPVGPTGHVVEFTSQILRGTIITSGSTATYGFLFNVEGNNAMTISPGPSTFPEISAEAAESILNGKFGFGARCTVGWDDVFEHRQNSTFRLNSKNATFVKHKNGSVQGKLVVGNIEHYVDNVMTEPSLS